MTTLPKREMRLVSVESSIRAVSDGYGNMNTMFYEIWENEGEINGPQMIVMTRDLFEKFAEEVHQARLARTK